MRYLKVLIGAAAVCGAAVLAGCEGKKAEAVAPPPATVTVSRPVQQTVSDFVELPGNLAAMETVDIRARVKGFLKQVAFVDGSYVKEGELLFQIDPDEFQASVDRAAATLSGAKARNEKAQADLKIKQEMAAGNAASKLEVIQAQANVDTSAADIASAEAALKQAKLDLGYTTIRAPLSGRIDRRLVDVGNLVGADGNTLLTTINKGNPIYVYFDADEATVQRFAARVRAMGKETVDKGNIPLTLALGDSGDFRFTGVLDYADNRVDASTGTIRLRGTLDNGERVLVPGYFARVRIPDGAPYQALLVPDRAIGVDQGQKYVLVVNEKHVVEARPLEVGSAQGRMRVVKKGLEAGDWVITEGILRTRPGATVEPIEKSEGGGGVAATRAVTTTQAAH